MPWIPLFGTTSWVHSSLHTCNSCFKCNVQFDFCDSRKQSTHTIIFVSSIHLIYIICWFSAATTHYWCLGGNQCFNCFCLLVCLNYSQILPFKNYSYQPILIPLVGFALCQQHAYYLDFQVSFMGCNLLFFVWLWGCLLFLTKCCQVSLKTL